MMNPNYILSYKFAPCGKNGYLSTDVDAFAQRVHESYAKVYNDNKILVEKNDASKRIVEEYKKTKNSIADTLILAKTTADKNIEEAKQLSERLISEATQNAEMLYEEKKAQADAYYNGRVAAADEKVAKAEAEFLNLKNQADVFSEKYIEEVNVKARKIIDDANSTAATVVADAFADVKKAKEKAEQILSDANNELNALKAQSAKIKNEILSLITLAQKAAEEVDNRIFDPIAAENSADEIVEVEQFDVEELEPFTLDAVEADTGTEETAEVNAEPGVSLADEDNSHPEFVRFFETKLPPVDDMFSGIFASLGREKAADKRNEDENVYKFNDIFADPADMGGTRRFNPVNDGE